MQLYFNAVSIVWIAVAIQLESRHKLGKRVNCNSELNLQLWMLGVCSVAIYGLQYKLLCFPVCMFARRPGQPKFCLLLDLIKARLRYLSLLLLFATVNVVILSQLSVSCSCFSRLPAHWVTFGNPFPLPWPAFQILLEITNYSSSSSFNLFLFPWRHSSWVGSFPEIPNRPTDRNYDQPSFLLATAVVLSFGAWSW